MDLDDVKRDIQFILGLNLVRFGWVMCKREVIGD